MAAPDDTERQEPTKPAPPAIRRPQPEVPDTDDDTEGHLYSPGPSTQGELLPRIPGDNPHGDR